MNVTFSEETKRLNKDPDLQKNLINWLEKTGDVKCDYCGNWVESDLVKPLTNGKKVCDFCTERE